MALRVLIVDDSPLVRGVLCHVLKSYADIEVVGEASNGLSARQMVTDLRPDVVTMDVLMPMMDGIEAIEAIMRDCPTAIVVVADSQGDAERLAMKALGAGAAEVFPKPREGFDDRVADALAETLRRAGSARVGPISRMQRHQTLSSFQVPRGAKARGLFIGLVGSTGGPRILQSVLGSLPADFPHPIAICQHTARGFTGSLATWLDSCSELQVSVAQAGQIVVPGMVVIAPDDAHLEIGPSGLARLSTAPAVDGHRPSCTVLLESIARSYGDRAVGIVVTGMGRDGARGAKAVEDAGGTVLVENPDTATVGGMPRETVALTRKPIVVRAEQLAAAFSFLRVR